MRCFDNLRGAFYERFPRVFCAFHRVPAEKHLASVLSAEQKIAVVERVVAFIGERLKAQKIPRGLRHFISVAGRVVFDDEEFVVQPIVYPFFAGRAFRLRDFVRVMNGYMVDAAGVNVEMIAEVFHAHRRALNVPAGIAFPPGAFPRQCLIFEFRFCKPQHEIVGIAFIFIDADSRSGFLIVEAEVCKLSVIGIRGHVVIEVSAGHIGMTVRFDTLYQFDHIGNVIGRFAHDVGTTDIERIQIFKKRIRIKLRDFEYRLMALFRRLDDFIFARIVVARKVPDIGDVHDVLFIVAEVGKRAIEYVEKHICAQVSDVRVIIHRRTAAVKADEARRNRHEILHFPSHRIEYP